MRIALLQYEIAWERPAENLEKIRQMAGRAKEGGADLILLPEMSTTGFTMNCARAAEADARASAKKLSAMAAELGVTIVAGLQLEPADPSRESKCRNSALVWDPAGKKIAEYQKMHPFAFAGEDRYYAAGDRTAVFGAGDFQASVFICYDLRFPEIFREVARSVNLMLVIANWPGTRKSAWEALLRARAIENQCFVAGVNRVGSDNAGIYHAGGSVVYDPLGEVMALAGSGEEILAAELEAARVADLRAEFPFLRDMRTGGS